LPDCYATTGQKDDFEFITSDEKISNGLKYNYTIHSLFQDRDDNIWVGTDRGLNVFNPYRPFFQTIRHVDGTATSLSNHDVNDVIETSQGEIMVATWGGGITFYDRNWNFLRRQEFTGPDGYNLVWCFVEKEDGKIWAGTQQGYIHEYDPVHHSSKLFSHQKWMVLPSIRCRKMPMEIS
jgi:ligand-binding sensor domain-containing protein